MCSLVIPIGTESFVEEQKSSPMQIEVMFNLNMQMQHTAQQKSA